MKRDLHKLSLSHQVVHNLILALTNNEDLQQDLWVSYLAGEITSTFTDKLKQLALHQDIQKTSSNNINYILGLNIQQSELDQLSDLQKSIFLLTILGYSLEQVGKYNKVKQVIINKEMVDLVKHSIWIENGLKEKSKLR